MGKILPKSGISKSKNKKWSDFFSDFNCEKVRGNNKNKNCQFFF